MNKKIKKKVKILTFIISNVAVILLSFICCFLIDYYKNLKFAFENNVLKLMWNSFKHHCWICLVLLISINLLLSLIYFVFPKLISKFKKNTSSESSVWLYNEAKNIGDKSLFEKIYKIKKPFVEEKNNKPGWIIKANLKEAYVLNQNQTLILGGTGAGKSQKVIIPSIYYNMCLNNESKPNMVITDLKGEITQIFAKPLENHGYDVKVLDLINPQNSMGYNMLENLWDICFANKEYPNFNKAFKQVDLLVYSLKNWNLNGNDEYWANGGIQLLYSSLCFLLLFGHYCPDKFKKEDFTFNNLLSLLDMTTFQNAKWFNAVYDQPNLVSEAYAIKDMLLGYITMPPNQLAGQMSFAVQAILPYVKDKLLNNVLLTSEIDFETMFTNNDKKPFVVLIKIPEDDETRSIVIVNFIQQLYQVAINHAEKNDNGRLERDLLYLLDEFGNLPSIPNMQTKLSAGRGRGIFFACVLQSINQLDIKYNSASKTIKDVFNSWIFLGGINNKETLEEISILIGKEKYKKTSTTTGDKTKTETSSTQEKSAMEISDLQKLKGNEALIIQKQEKALLLKVLMAYQYLKYDMANGTAHLKDHLKDVLVIPFDFKMENNLNSDSVTKNQIKDLNKRKKEAVISKETKETSETSLNQKHELKTNEITVSMNVLINWVCENEKLVAKLLDEAYFMELIDLIKLKQINRLDQNQKMRLRELLLIIKNYYLEQNITLKNREIKGDQ